MRSQGIALIASMSVAAVAGCGDGGSPPSGSELSTAFEDAVAEVGEDSGECFALDESGTDAFLQSLDYQPEPESTNYGFIQDFDDPNGDEGVNVSCGIAATIGEDGPESGAASIFVGLTPMDAAEFQSHKESESGDEPIEGEAPGLDAEEVFGLDSGTVGTYAWVSDGFFVALAMKSEPDPEAGFEALSVLVPEVARTLGAD